MDNTRVDDGATFGFHISMREWGLPLSVRWENRTHLRYCSIRLLCFALTYEEWR